MPHKKNKSKDSVDSPKPEYGLVENFPRQPSLDHLRAAYIAAKDLYLRSPYALHFRNIYTTRINPLQEVPINNALCIGLGTLSKVPARPSHPLNSYTQLAAFDSWIQCVRSEQKKTSGGEIRLKEVYLQDPAFTEVDIKFIQEDLGFTVIKDPAAFAVITDETLLFAPFPPLDIKYSILHAASPGILVGNRLGSVVPWSKFSDWCLSKDTITSFYTSRNFATLASPDCIQRDENNHVFAWLDAMALYYPAAKEDDHILKLDVDHAKSDNEPLDSCAANIMTLYNVSNTELNNWYAKLPKNITFKDMLASVSEPGKCPIGAGPGVWTDVYGFVFEPFFLGSVERIKKESEKKALEVLKDFLIMNQLEHLALAEDIARSLRADLNVD